MLQKLPLEKIKKFSWKAVWAGGWSLLACSDWGDFYVKTLVVGNKPFLQQVIFLIHDGKSSAWVDEMDVENFSKRVAKKVNGKLSEVKRIIWQTKEETRRALLFMEQNKNKINYEIYQKYLKVIRDYYIPHREVKYVAEALPEKLLKKFLPILQEVRVFAEPVFSTTIEFDKNLALMISQATGIKSELILCMTQKELEIYFKTGKVPNQGELEIRHKLSALVCLNKVCYLYTGQAASLIEKAMIGESGTRELKGSCAFPGKIVGRVRIVKNPKEAKDFKTNDILVASMTRPEYLPIMKKASAIVTDAGGILSHAAIVAREIKKPCIIGTTIATKVLKDGDLVEVDATKGIVKIINKA